MAPGARAKSSDLILKRVHLINSSGVENLMDLQNAKSKVAMPTDEDDQDGHFFYNHPERGAYPAA